MKSLIAGIFLVLSSTSIVSKPTNSNVNRDNPTIETPAMITKHAMVVDPVVTYQRNNQNKKSCNTLACWDLIIKDHVR